MVTRDVMPGGKYVTLIDGQDFYPCDGGFRGTWPTSVSTLPDSDNNPRTDGDVSFKPFITTPCFPSYPSAHGTQSNAAREVLERLYGRRHRSLTISSEALGITIHYRTLAQITDDIADARIYGGIHFRFDQDEGADQGRRVGEYIYRHVLGRRRNGEGDERSHSR